MIGTWIHFNLKRIKMFKDQTQKINTCSKSTVETIKGEKICSKLAIKIVAR